MKAPLIFLHIPKTAGTTLRSILSSKFSGSATYTIGNDINSDIEALRNMNQADRHRIQLLQGHMSFGLHEYLAPGARYLTVLRDPVERVLSEFRFLKTNTRHPFHAAVAPMTLVDYLESEYNGQSRNGQTRLLCGNHEPGQPGIAGTMPLDRGDLDRAKNNLNQHFVVAGTQSRFVETLLLCRQRLGWLGYPFFIPRNITRGDALDTSEQDRELVRSSNELDTELYRYVEGNLERDLAEQPPGFAGTLNRFHRLNPWYGRFYMRWNRLSRR